MREDAADAAAVGDGVAAVVVVAAAQWERRCWR